MKRTCLLIPGNPAIAGYYHAWMKEIEARNHDVEMHYATSYVIFDKKLDYTQYDLAMRKHYEAIFLALPASGKITLLAHSVGSYFALHLLETYPDRIEKVIIMFPYIGYSTIWYMKLLCVPYWIDRALPLAEFVSKHKNFFGGIDREIRNIPEDDLKANLRFGVRQCVYFNRYKFDTSKVSAFKDKIHFIYTEGDRWCPQAAIEALKPVSMSKKVDIPHDFIVDISNRQKMDEQLRGIL